MLCWIDLGFARGQRRNIAGRGASLTIAILVLHKEVSDSFSQDPARQGGETKGIAYKEREGLLELGDLLFSK
jgi:hypothetical protein